MINFRGERESLEQLTLRWKDWLQTYLKPFLVSKYVKKVSIIYKGDDKCGYLA